MGDRGGGGFKESGRDFIGEVGALREKGGGNGQVGLCVDENCNIKIRFLILNKQKERTKERENEKGREKRKLV